MLGHGLTWFAEWYDLTGDASDYVLAMDSPRAIAPWQKEWMKRFEDKFGIEPSIADAGHPYHYFRMSMQAINTAGTLDFETLVETLREMEYKGGRHLSKFSKEAGPRALAPHEVMTDGCMEGVFFP